MGLSPHPLLISEARSNRKQVMFFRTWNMLTATFSLTSCCKMSSLFSTGSFFNQWLFISGLVVIFGRPCWLVIKTLSLWGEKDESPFLLKRKLIELFKRILLTKKDSPDVLEYSKCFWIEYHCPVNLDCLILITSAILFMIEHLRTCYRSNSIPG